MAAAGVQIVGAKRLRRTLKAAGIELEDLKAANAAVASLVAQAAAGRAPKRTGRLAASVRGNRAQARATVLAGRASVPYAGPIHWGWPRRGIKANPFLADTAAALEPAWIAIYTREVEKAINKIEGA
jgi:hypothetical protein